MSKNHRRKGRKVKHSDKQKHGAGRKRFKELEKKRSRYHLAKHDRLQMDRAWLSFDDNEKELE